MGSGVPTTRPTRRRSRQPGTLYVLRLVPGTSQMHRLWAGTKVLCVVAIVLTLTLVPSWPCIALFASLDLVAARFAKVPRTVVPRLPAWFWVTLLIGALLALAAGRPPTLVLGSFHVGLGSLLTFLRAVAFGVVLLASSAVVAWTTPLGDLAPALSRMGAPLRKLRVPVDELAATVALCVRCLPLLADEMRTLLAARRLRHPRYGRSVTEDSVGGDGAVRHATKFRQTMQRVVAEPADLLGASLAVSMRRAGELGEAITARGGVSAGVGSRPGPAVRDAVAGAVVVAACVAALALHFG
jgi:energy-coupling factor transport system permease protein